MGGKNHQPCKSYLEASTRLSRSLSLAESELELANVTLEDALLAELTQGPASFGDPITLRLTNSCKALTDALAHCSSLRTQMAESDFVDLPTLHGADLSGIGTRLSKNGLLPQGEWHLVADLLREGGFRSVLSQIEERIVALRSLTQDLLEGVRALDHAFTNGTLTAILECNRPGNIKQPFARLYCAWSTFNHFFLASSLFSTELWYIYTGCGSLCSETGVSRVA